MNEARDIRFKLYQVQIRDNRIEGNNGHGNNEFTCFNTVIPIFSLADNLFFE